MKKYFNRFNVCISKFLVAILLANLFPVQVVQGAELQSVSQNVNGNSEMVLMESTMNFTDAKTMEQFDMLEVNDSNEAAFVKSQESTQGICSNKEGDDVTYVLNDGVLTISGTGNMSNWTSESNVPWHDYREMIESVIITEGVTSIGGYAFSGCTNLKELSISGSVTSLGSEIIKDTKIETITIPKNVSSCSISVVPPFIGANGPLAGATHLKEVIFEDGMEVIPPCICASGIKHGSFIYENHIEKVVIPNSVKIIGYYAFNGCKIQEITIPSSTETIGDYAFYGCDSLEIVSIPKTVTSILTDVFSECNKLAIYGYADSYAQSFAEEQNIPFVALDDEEDDDYFILGVDTNRFVHYGLPYSIDNSEYKTKLKSSLMTWDGTFQLYKYLNGKTSGVCHGIAVTMCYGNQGFLDFDNIVKNANNYWELGDPRDNTKFKDVIVYYHLLQLSTEGKATKTLDKGGWHISSQNERMKDFLESLINEAKKSNETKKPFIFSFRENGDGHSVVVCGYKWNNNKKCHEIKIYDENSFGGANGKYTIFSIPENCQSFDFADAIAEAKGYKIQDVWSSLSYYSIDQIYGSKYILPKMARMSGMSSQTTLQISYGKKFRLENSKGEWLASDGENYSGNMQVYDCYTSGLDEYPVWNITVDSSDTFILKEAEDACELIATVEGKGYAVSSSGAESVQIKSDGVEAMGQSYELNIAMQSDQCDFVEMKADIVGTAIVTDNDGEVILETEKGFSNAEIYLNDEFETEKLDTEIDEDGRLIVVVPEETHTHVGGAATCKEKARCSICGEEYGELAVHSYSTKWSTDAKNHWHACTVCGVKKDGATHTDSNKDGKCDTCSYNMHSHSGTKIAQVDSTCTSYGLKAYYKCSCGKYYSDLSCTKEITDLAVWKSGDGRIAKKNHTSKTTVTKATLKANGKKETMCSVCAKVTKKETIYMAKTIKLSATKYTYDGKTKKPSVTIKDSKGNAISSSNYTVKYPSGRKNVGKYAVKVTFKGNYSGSKNLTFIINPPKTTISKVTKVTTGKKAFIVKWTKKTTQVTGYEIQYSTSSTFAKGNKTVKVTLAKTVSKTIKNLKAKKKYYIRIRTYKTVNKVKYYSDWSAKKSVTTKK